MLQEIGMDAEVIETATPAEMKEQLRRLAEARARIVVVAGGDGTVHTAAQELAHSDTCLGILPQGTSNNFATALRLPMDVRDALRVVRDGGVQRVDLGRVSGSPIRTEYFTEAAGVGLYAEMLAIYGAGPRKSLLRGIYAILATLYHVRPHAFRLTIDGEERIERGVMCTAANCSLIGMSMPLAPDAHLTDGLLDFVIIGRLRPAELVRYYRACMSRALRSFPQVTIRRVKEVTIETRRPMNLHCDDHILTRTPATIRVEPGALLVLVEKL